MKTLLIRGDSPVPPKIREILRAGSTELKEIRADEERDAAALEADRFVVWDGRELEIRSARGQADVTRLRWPDDEDKLLLFFETGG